MNTHDVNVHTCIYMYIHCTCTVPVIKKLKYSTAGTERVRSRFARGAERMRK